MLATDSKVCTDNWKMLTMQVIGKVMNNIIIILLKQMYKKVTVSVQWAKSVHNV